MSGFIGIGICAECGDTEGTWVWFEGRWLCDSCVERKKKNEKADSACKKQDKSGRADGLNEENETSME